MPEPGESRRSLAGRFLAWLGGPAARRAVGDRLAAHADQVQREFEHVAARLQQLEHAARSVAQGDATRAAAMAERCTRIEAAVDRLEAAMRAGSAAGEIADLRAAVQYLRRLNLGLPHTNPGATVEAGTSSQFDFEAFHRVFRGPSALIRDQLQPYAGRFPQGGTVADLGCGRGEFLEACRDAGVEAIGVELHAAQVAAAREAGLTVEQGDLVEWLRSRAPASLDGVFSAHVIEHLPFEQLPDVFREIHRVLRPGGLGLLETVNPHNPVAFRLFFLDPTHQRPLFPEVLDLIARGAGFAAVGVEYPERGEPHREPHFEAGEYAVRVERSH